MEIRLRQITERVTKDGNRQPIERIYMCYTITGEPIVRATFRNRVITLEAVGESTFDDSQIMQEGLLRRILENDID